MVNENFGTLKDLYNRVLPALKSRVKELKQKQIFFVTEKDIWDCLRKKKWKEETDLTLYDIVNDILFIEEKEILNYINSEKKKETEHSDNRRFESKEIKEKQNEEDTLL